MELSFSINNAGPLNQISVPLFNLSSAIQLAIGSYGWWRARERNQSLVATIGAAGASLVSTSSFNLPPYEEMRLMGTVRGVCVEEEAVRRATLPRASTANIGDPGQKCLRALTTGLLCLFDEQEVTEILAEALPYALLNFDQDGKSFRFEGPLQTSLREYVKAVEKEEDNNSLRQVLLNEADNYARSLEAGIKPAVGAWNFRSDNWKTRALLRWLLKPITNRCPFYLTRSLLAWNMAVVLSQLGFQVSPSRTVISCNHQYEAYIEGRTQRTCGFDVFLTTGSDVQTDPIEGEVIAEDLKLGSFSPLNTFKSRILQIRSIPWFAFRKSPGIDEKDIRSLAEVWDYTFDTVRRSIRGPTQHQLYRVWHIPDEELEDCQVIKAEHKDLLRVWSPDLYHILRKPMVLYVKPEPEHQGLANELETYAKRLRKDAWEAPPPSISKIWNTMTSIILASLYAMISLVLVDDAKPAGAHTEVAFHPYTAFSSQVESWANSLASHLVRDSGMGAASWRAQLFEMVTGSWGSRYGDDDNNPRRADATMTPYRWDVYGSQRNGILVISELLVKPSPNPFIRIMHHTSAGHVITLPVDQSGYIRSCPTERGRKLLSPSERKGLAVLGSSSKDIRPIKNRVRIDVEPAWETDQTTVVLTVRLNGERIAGLTPINFDTALDHRFESVQCSCGSFSKQTRVSEGGTWQCMAFVDLLTYGQRITLPKDINLVVDVGDDKMAQLFVVYAVDSSFTLLAKDCMSCAYRRVLARQKKGFRDVSGSNFIDSSYVGVLIINGIP